MGDIILSGAATGGSSSSGNPVTVNGAASATDTLTATDDFFNIVPGSGVGSITIQITGVWSGVIDLFASNDGSNLFTIYGWDASTFSTDPISGSITTNKDITIPINGYAKVVVYATSWTSGTATITVVPSAGSAVRDSVAQAYYFDGLIWTPWTGQVNVNNLPGAFAVNIQDGGNSITVDGAVSVSGTITANQGTPAATANRWPVQITDGTDLALVTAAGEVNVIATAQPGVDIGDVTINNAAGASAVNIQDGGNSITVDGTVTITPSGTQDVNLTKVGGTNVTLGQKVMNESIPVVLAQDQAEIPVSVSALGDDASGVLTAVGDVVLLSVLNSSNALMIQVSGPVEGLEFVVEGFNTFGPALLPFRSGNSAEAIFSSGLVSSSSINDTKIFYCNIFGFTSVQVRATAIRSDFAVVLMSALPWDGPTIQYPDNLVSDVPPNYSPTEKQPLSLTTDGRLRVSSIDATIDKIWQSTFDNPWGYPDSKEDNPSYGSSATLAFTSGDLYV